MREKRRSLNRRKNKSTIFDDVFRTTVSIPFLLINLVNEMFDVNYAYDEKVTYHKEEFPVKGKKGKVICDCHVSIGRLIAEVFHLECQTLYDSSIQFRMYQYDFQIAFDDAKIINGKLVTRMPISGVVYLNRYKKLPDHQEIVITDQNGNSFTHKIKNLQLAKYTVEELLNRKLYSLLPFFFFTYGIYPYDNLFEDEDAYENFKNDLDRIMKFLAKNLEEKTINVYVYETLIEMIRKIVIYLCSNNETAEREVMEIMGGTVLEIEGIKRINEMLAESEANGRSAGLKEGIKEGQNLLLNKLVSEGIIDQKIADRYYCVEKESKN